MNQQTVELLERAVQLIRAYEQALDNQLYRHRDVREDIKMCEMTADQLEQLTVAFDPVRDGLDKKERIGNPYTERCESVSHQ